MKRTSNITVRSLTRDEFYGGMTRSEACEVARKLRANGYAAKTKHIGVGRWAVEHDYRGNGKGEISTKRDAAVFLVGLSWKEVTGE